MFLIHMIKGMKLTFFAFKQIGGVFECIFRQVGFLSPWKKRDKNATLQNFEEKNIY